MNDSNHQSNINIISSNSNSNVSDDDFSIENDEPLDKIDPITVLQDNIDGLSLAMFDALRQLRDAVAPESGNLGNTNNNNRNDDTEHALDTDELWKAYKAKDPDVLAMVPSMTGINSREDFERWHAQHEMDKDKELVTQLAAIVLEKSRAIDQQVQHHIPGMHRTRPEQKEYMAQLVQENVQVARELEQTYAQARQQRDRCRAYIRENTCRALGIKEDSEAVFL
ncbi:hypothetical protein FisN_15Lh054 [Fistulifera solaris]|uniref:Mediator of RNA polymerase II transcription subunit 21 n=1 Tax=Fistulifera solaris TaxID=1519565 RepID=A0A1Z5KHU0_FISSO|nr:hypothetical protein FisN_15Lh054 [Fistulifera solaris]|eukprot:GAX25685.1 hypothetical protein FisN_15Lh054 [Fistulifera solaris]